MRYFVNTLVCSLILYSCAVSVSEVKFKGTYPVSVVKMKGKALTPSHGVIIIGEPGVRAKIYTDAPGGLGRYLSKKGFEVWVYEITERDSLESLRDGVIPALVDMFNAESGFEEISIICHGFSCLPVLEAVHRGYRKYLIRDIVMISPPLFFWQFSRAFKYFLEKEPNISAYLEKNPPFAKSGESLLELLFCDRRMTEDDKKFILSAIKPIPASWLTVMKSFVERGTLSYVQTYCSLEVPAIVVAGQVDGYIPYWASVPPELKEKKCDGKFRFFGRANFDRKEYSHMGLLVGEDAGEEIFPFIYNWLKFGWKDSNWMRDYSSFPGE